MLARLQDPTGVLWFATKNPFTSIHRGFKEAGPRYLHIPVWPPGSCWSLALYTMLCQIKWGDLIWSYLVIPHHVISYHIMSYHHIISCHIISVISYHALCTVDHTVLIMPNLSTFVAIYIMPYHDKPPRYFWWGVAPCSPWTTVTSLWFHVPTNHPHQIAPKSPKSNQKMRILCHNGPTNNFTSFISLQQVTLVPVVPYSPKPILPGFGEIIFGTFQPYLSASKWDTPWGDLIGNGWNLKIPHFWGKEKHLPKLHFLGFGGVSRLPCNRI